MCQCGRIQLELQLPACMQDATLCQGTVALIETAYACGNRGPEAAYTGVLTALCNLRLFMLTCGHRHREVRPDPRALHAESQCWPAQQGD